MTPTPFCCDINSGSVEERNEFKRLHRELIPRFGGFSLPAYRYYGVNKNGISDCYSNTEPAIAHFTRIIPLSEGIAILKEMVGEEEKPDRARTYSLNEVREIAVEYRNTCLYAHSHKLTRLELQSELTKIEEKHNLTYKEGVDFNPPKP